MDFQFSDDQNAIRDLANQIFSDRATDEFLLEFDRNDETYDDHIWNTMAEQGLLGICVPEEFGGTGLGFVELCCILEELGRTVAPTPIFSSLVFGGLPIEKFGSQAQKEKYLGGLATGSMKLTAAVGDFGATEAYQHQVSDEGGKLNGVKTAVLDGAVADAVIVAAGDSVYIVDTKASGVSIEAQSSYKGDNFATLTLENVEAELLGDAGQAEEILGWLEQFSDVALCAMQMGCCDEALKRTAEFTGERKQFGAPIGSFQAVAMRAADAYIDCEAMRSAYWGALWRVAEGLPGLAEARVAKYWACQGSHRVVHACQHLHGGMGADREYPIHRFFILSKQIAFMTGNAAVTLSKLGKMLADHEEVGLNSLDVD